jgi:hypothetical protein
MKKVIRLTESDLMRIVRRVISEGEKFGSFDNKEWRDKNDKLVKLKDDEDYENEEEFPDFKSLDSKHGKNTKWFPSGERGEKMFDTYKDKHQSPFKVRTKRDK